MAKAKGTRCKDCGQENCRKYVSTKCVNFNQLTATESVFIILATFLSVTAGVLYASLLTV